MPLNTSDVTVLSSLHGRTQRALRGIDKRELQAAVKHGRKERANPGRNGDSRWRYTHEGVRSLLCPVSCACDVCDFGKPRALSLIVCFSVITNSCRPQVVYITDETSRHEITSWRLNDSSISAALAGSGSGGAHAVLVVDNSGSMRKNDVAGYASRTAAVYDCLVKDFVLAQVAAGGAGEVVVTLIEMSDVATEVLSKVKLDDWALQVELTRRQGERARSHGNYLPALDAALQALQHDAADRQTLMLLFLSDGEPSDHLQRECEHGVRVWSEEAEPTMRRRSGRANLKQCPAFAQPWRCRREVKTQVQDECLQKMREIGDVLGRDRVVVAVVAFGDVSQDYSVLQQMGHALPRGSFRKLALNANGLRTAFSSLSSSLTTLTTDAGGGDRTQPRKTVVKEQGKEDDGNLVYEEKGWQIYNEEQTNSSPNGARVLSAAAPSPLLCPPVCGVLLFAVCILLLSCLLLRALSFAAPSPWLRPHLRPGLRICCALCSLLCRALSFRRFFFGRALFFAAPLAAVPSAAVLSFRHFTLSSFLNVNLNPTSSPPTWCLRQCGCQPPSQPPSCPSVAPLNTHPTSASAL